MLQSVSDTLAHCSLFHNANVVYHVGIGYSGPDMNGPELNKAIHDVITAANNCRLIKRTIEDYTLHYEYVLDAAGALAALLENEIEKLSR